MDVLGIGNLAQGQAKKAPVLRLAIFGATGGTGLELTRQAMEAGHQVRVLVRNPNRMRLTNPEQMRVVMGDVLDAGAVNKTLLGSNAAMVCLGQRTLLRNTGVVSQGVRLILQTMKRQGVGRLIVESDFGAGESLRHASFFERVLFQTLLRAPYADKNIMEPEVMSSELEWTILRPTRLTNAAASGRYTITLLAPAQKTVARAEVAAAMLRAAEENLWVREAPTITGG